MNTDLNNGYVKTYVKQEAISLHQCMLQCGLDQVFRLYTYLMGISPCGQRLLSVTSGYIWNMWIATSKSIETGLLETLGILSQICEPSGDQSMENRPSITEFPSKTSIHRGVSLAMFPYQRVNIISSKQPRYRENWSVRQKIFPTHK